MNYLGIDYGTKRVGLAIARSGARMAFPHSVVENTSELVTRLVELCGREHINVLVIGNSLSNSGEPNPIMKKVRPFADELSERTGLTVEYMNEAYSSKEAMHVQGDNAMNDASSACLVLQSYLDSVSGASH